MMLRDYGMYQGTCMYLNDANITTLHKTVNTIKYFASEHQETLSKVRKIVRKSHSLQ